MNRAIFLGLTLVFVASPSFGQEPAGADPDPEPAGDSTQDSTQPTDDSTERARALFAEGVAHAAESRYSDAASSFRAALQLRAAPAIEYNLARALVELDELVKAYRLLQRAAQNPEASDTIRSDADSLRAQLEPRISLVTISLGGIADGVRVDGRDLRTDEIGVPIPLTPGPHELVGMRGGEELSRRALTLRPGVDTVVDVSVVQSPREAAESMDPEIASDDSGSRTGLVIGLAAAAVAVVVLVIVVAVVAGGGTQSPVRGDFEPGVIRW